MTAQHFLKHFEELLEAPNAIPKLRGLILQLAACGRLVPQNPSDEPASELLERILAERRRLMMQGVIRDRMELPPVGERAVPYGLPASWRWARIGYATTYGEAGKVEPGAVREGTWVLELEDIEKTTSRLLTRQRFPQRAFQSTKTAFVRGDVLYGKLRPYLDKVVVADEDGVCTTEIIPLRGLAGVDSGYLRLALKSPYFVAYADESTHGMNLPRLGTEKARMGLIPIPPVAEQKRIVAKVDELMALCDGLEARQLKKRAVRVALNRACLRAVTRPNGAGLATAWHRVRDNFDTLYCVPETVAELRQTILQLAIMGRLVPQDPHDEPASELLKRAQAKRHRRITEGTASRCQSPPVVEAKELLPQLPAGWAWTRLEELAAAGVNSIKRGPFGSAIRKAFFTPHGYKVYEQQHAITGDFARGTYYIPRGKFLELSSFELQPGDVIVSCSGTVGRTAIAPAEMERGIINQALLKITLNPACIVAAYFRLLFEAYVMNTRQLSDLAGTAQKNIVGVRLLKTISLPLPPLSEQQRIVTKVAELMTLCDDLESSLRQTQARGDELLDAPVRELVGGAGLG